MSKSYHSRVAESFYGIEEMQVRGEHLIIIANLKKPSPMELKLEWGTGYSMHVLEWQCSFAEVVQHTIVACEACARGLWTAVLLNISNATNKYHCAHHGTAIALLISMHFTN